MPPRKRPRNAWDSLFTRSKRIMPSGCSSSAAARMSGWVAEQKGNNNKTFVIYLFIAASFANSFACHEINEFQIHSS